MHKYCMALDLKENEELIQEYGQWHQESRPEIKESILAAGMESVEIYRTSNRLFMVMETKPS